MSEESFRSRTGHEAAADVEPGRERQVAQAWASLRQIRRVVQPEHSEFPAPWERNQPLRAVGIALEAAGIPFCVLEGEDVVASGVQLQAEGRGVVRVSWRYVRGQRPVDAGEGDLYSAERVLTDAGWDALLYRAGRGRFLLVEPGRAG